MNITKAVAIFFAGCIIGTFLHGVIMPDADAKPVRIDNPERVQNTADMRDMKADVEWYLDPATVDDIRGMADVRVYLKKEQAIMSVLVRDYFKDL